MLLTNGVHCRLSKSCTLSALAVSLMAESIMTQKPDKAVRRAWGHEGPVAMGSLLGQASKQAVLQPLVKQVQVPS